MTVIYRLLNGLFLVSVMVALIGMADSAFATPTCSACGIVKGAPGPIAGAGLPMIAIGYGAFWLVRRFRHKPE